ncbi:MAG: hypothetical protein QOK14_1137, partial [Frankiaceae bacterium]|nr:hypothetical protein [Frankiaceae bacterium]
MTTEKRARYDGGSKDRTPPPLPEPL